ncbi:hypothetical protein PUN28_017170 [Cardiocondyla obscurior]|uniref:Uncharacterized protein n=1 Tax=Cardiocondyla obscurior TaxID=286306 RepID=A0AAW2ER11_9HYME
MNKNLLALKQKMNKKKNNYKNLTLTGNDQMIVAESIVIYTYTSSYDIYVCVCNTQKLLTSFKLSSILCVLFSFLLLRTRFTKQNLVMVEVVEAEDYRVSVDSYLPVNNNANRNRFLKRRLTSPIMSIFINVD